MFDALCVFMIGAKTGGTRGNMERRNYAFFLLGVLVSSRGFYRRVNRWGLFAYYSLLRGGFF